MRSLESLIAHVHGLFDEESEQLWEQAQLVRTVKIDDYWDPTSGDGASFAKGQIDRIAELLEAKAHARRYRLAGKVAIALRYEEKAERRYQALAPHWRW